MIKNLRNDSSTKAKRNSRKIAILFLIIELKFYTKFYKNVEILIFLHEYKIIRRTKSTIILKFNDVNIIEKKMA